MHICLVHTSEQILGARQSLQLPGMWRWLVLIGMSQLSVPLPRQRTLLEIREQIDERLEVVPLALSCTSRTQSSSHIPRTHNRTRPTDSMMCPQRQERPVPFGICMPWNLPWTGKCIRKTEVDDAERAGGRVRCRLRTQTYVCRFDSVMDDAPCVELF